MNSKERCLAALAGQPADRTPVVPVLMFLAADRLGVSYRRFATDAQALVDAQLNMRRRFGVDGITACSDAFRVSADLGGEMAYPEDKPPYLARPLVTNEAGLAALRRPDPSAPGSRMADRLRGVAGLARGAGADCLVIGWVEMPFAEACSVCGVANFMLLLVDQPALAHRILSFLTEIEIDFAVAQIAAGAPMIGAGDAAASLVSARVYREFVLPYEQQVCAAVHARGGTVKLHICGKTGHLLVDMVRSGADLFNVDHLVDLAAARRVYEPAGKCYKGNLNPVGDMLDATPEACHEKALACLRLAEGSRYMLSPGCEVPAGVTDETFTAFCRAPQDFAAEHAL